MPITIYNQNTDEKLAWLYDEIWSLPDQIDTLEKWLKTKGVLLPKGSYVHLLFFDITGCITGLLSHIERVPVLTINV